jgi:quercetin dioxygenase-like cupin family protein
MMTKSTLLAVAAVVAVTGIAISPAQAAPPDGQDVERDILQTVPVEAPTPQHAVTGIVTFPAGSSAGHHIHHGIESGYVLDGEVEVLIDGQPGRVFRAGETFVTTRDHPHISRNPGTVESHAVVTWVIDANKPLTEAVS